MAPEPARFSQKIMESVELPVWGRLFLAIMAGSVLAQLLVITLSVARILPHLQVFLKAAYVGLFSYWVFGGIGCLAFLALFWNAFRRTRRLHLAILGLAAFAVLLHAFLKFAFQLLLGHPGTDPVSGLGRGVWALFQPGHGTAYLTLGFELLRILGLIPFAAYWKILRFLFLLDATAVAGLYLLLWIQVQPLRSEAP